MERSHLPHGWRVLASVALVLAAASIALSAFLFSNLHTVAIEGCERQNDLRRELNSVLHSFHEPPRFSHVDCARAYAVSLP